MTTAIIMAREIYSAIADECEHEHIGYCNLRRLNSDDMKTVDIISDMAKAFDKKHAKTDWEESEIDYESAIVVFVNKYLSKL